MAAGVLLDNDDWVGSIATVVHALCRRQERE